MYPITRNAAYDFAGQSYASSYPNLHRYPATMLPQIGIALLEEFNIRGGALLDPYCGSGSSFVAGLERDMTRMDGFDLNPLAILLCKAKFTKVDPNILSMALQQVRQQINQGNSQASPPRFQNIDYWFSTRVQQALAGVKQAIDGLVDRDAARLLLVAFSETVRDCSYVRNSEFKLYRIPPEQIEAFNPDVNDRFLAHAQRVIDTYCQWYYPHLGEAQLNFEVKAFTNLQQQYEVVLTSPPYGDSKTTVAYGQFSTFANEWLGVSEARRVDAMLMGGRAARFIYTDGLIAEAIGQICEQSPKRAYEVSAFYQDLAASIRQVAAAIKPNGTAIYIVGNRRVKQIQLPTDQFIAETFERCGLRHIVTYERLLSNKVMPSRNSPTNRKGDTVETMSREYIVVCQKPSQ